MMNLILPMVVISMLTMLSFYLPAESGMTVFPASLIQAFQLLMVGPLALFCSVIKYTPVQLLLE